MNSITEGKDLCSTNDPAYTIHSGRLVQFCSIQRYRIKRGHRPWLRVAYWSIATRKKDFAEIESGGNSPTRTWRNPRGVTRMRNLPLPIWEQMLIALTRGVFTAQMGLCRQLLSKNKIAGLLLGPIVLKSKSNQDPPPSSKLKFSRVFFGILLGKNTMTLLLVELKFM